MNKDHTIIPFRFVAIDLFSAMTWIPKKTIYTALKDGRLIGVRFGKRILIDTLKLENDLVAQEQNMELDKFSKKTTSLRDRLKIA